MIRKSKNFFYANYLINAIAAICKISTINNEPIKFLVKKKSTFLRCFC